MKTNETPIDFIMDLHWDKDAVDNAKNHLLQWENRDDSFYKNFSKLDKKVDQAEREHLRASIKYWEKRLDDESKH